MFFEFMKMRQRRGARLIKILDFLQFLRSNTSKASGLESHSYKFRSLFNPLGMQISIHLKTLK